MEGKETGESDKRSSVRELRVDGATEAAVAPGGRALRGLVPKPCGVTSGWRGCRGAQPSRGGPALLTVAGVGRVEGPQPPAPSLPGLLEPGVSRWEGPRGGARQWRTLGIPCNLLSRVKSSSQRSW